MSTAGWTLTRAETLPSPKCKNVSAHGKIWFLRIPILVEQVEIYLHSTSIGQVLYVKYRLLLYTSYEDPSRENGLRQSRVGCLKRYDLARAHDSFLLRASISLLNARGRFFQRVRRILGFLLVRIGGPLWSTDNETYALVQPKHGTICVGAIARFRANHQSRLLTNNSTPE